MRTITVTPEVLAKSVIAVPPLARDSNGRICNQQNTRIIQHLESAGISTLLYGGNAVFYHLRPSEYAAALNVLVENTMIDTLVIPSVGPSYGMMMDQAEVLKDYPFPTVMILPQKEIADEKGIVSGIHKFVASFGKPIVLYLKHDRWLSPTTVQGLVRDGMVSWIKYAVVRDNPARDEYLDEILSLIPNNILVSGIGEQPAIIHMRDFGMSSFTSGCVCVAPELSLEMLRSIQSGDFDKAEEIREKFVPLEDLRNSINPIRVLHHAVSATIAPTGPMQPMLGELTDEEKAGVSQAAMTLKDRQS
jgi:dihydrodipicolinate synthase/N-acetylneuraminate lyase